MNMHIFYEYILKSVYFRVWVNTTSVLSAPTVMNRDW